jgi:hypothetical protein
MLDTEKLTGMGDLDIICFCSSVGASLKKEMVFMSPAEQCTELHKIVESKSLLKTLFSETT